MMFHFILLSVSIFFSKNNIVVKGRSLTSKIIENYFISVNILSETYQISNFLAWSRIMRKGISNICTESKMNRSSTVRFKLIMLTVKIMVCRQNYSIIIVFIFCNALHLSNRTMLRINCSHLSLFPSQAPTSHITLIWRFSCIMIT